MDQNRFGSPIPPVSGLICPGRCRGRGLGDICDERLAELFPKNERRNLEDDRLREFHATANALMHETGKSVACNVWNERSNTVEHLAAAIKTTPATTLTGLLVKAEAMVWFASSSAASTNIVDWEDYQAACRQYPKARLTLR